MQNIYVIQLQTNELGIWEVYAMSEELQKLFYEEQKEREANIIINLIKNKTQIKTIAESFGVEEKYVYQIAKTNNLQINEG